jgi:paraquat-inducible protein B
VQVAGLSLVDKSLNELYDTYIRTRVAVKEAMPDASALMGLQQKVSNAARDLKVSKITAQDYERMKTDLEELQEALSRSQSFITTISTAVNPNNLSVSSRDKKIRAYCYVIVF